MGSILNETKKLLGIEPEYTHFDQDIQISINSALMSLNQLGVGPKTGFIITGPTETWSSILGDRKDLEQVKTYVYLKTRLSFDPPSSSFTLSAYERQIQELEWRINVQAETIVEGGITNA